MATDVKLASKVQDVHDEIAKVKKKIELLDELGADTAGLKTFLGERMKAITEDLIREAQTEIVNAQEMALRLNQGIRPPIPDPNAADPAVVVNEDIERLQEVEEERKRIREKLKHARRHAPAGEDTDAEDDLEEDLDKLDKEIRRAANEAAKREIKELDREIQNIRRGKPKKGEGKGPAADPGKGKQGKQGEKGEKGEPGKDGGGGGVPAGGGDADDIDLGIDSFGIQDGEARLKLKAGQKPLEIATIHVRNANTVWAWNARDELWMKQEFGSDLIDVKDIADGILAYSADKAALYDTYEGDWLPSLDVQGADLTEGSSSSATMKKQ